MCKIHIYIDSETFRQIPLKNVGFLVNDTLAKWGFEILIFWSIFGDRMTNLGLIDCKIGLYIKVNVNVRQNKFEVHIYQVAQYGHQLAQNRPDATLATWTLFGYLVIFHPILMVFLRNACFLMTNLMVTITKLYFL